MDGKMRSAGTRRGITLPSTRGTTPIGIGVIPGIIATMDGTAHGTTLGITVVATTGIVLTGMAAIIMLSIMVAAVDAAACTPAMAIRELLT